MNAKTVCECGVNLDVHLPLPAPKPWSHGRPCALLASPFASLAAWHLIEPPKWHVCGWCGWRFEGAYEWVCSDCEWSAF